MTCTVALHQVAINNINTVYQLIMLMKKNIRFTTVLGQRKCYKYIYKF